MPELQQEAARFFGAGAGPAPLASQAQSLVTPMSAQPFDLAGLRDALPGTVPRVQIGAAASAAWAADFLARSTASQPAQAQGQRHAQAGPTARVDVQPGLTVPMGGMRSAFFVRHATCLLTFFILFILLHAYFSGNSFQVVHFRGVRCIQSMERFR